jgi:hypothetical protein
MSCYNKQTMRVALCFFGQPRQARKGIATFRDLIQRHAHDVEFDVYFHAWHDPLQTRYAASPWRNIPEEDLVVDPSIIDSLLQAYRPVAHLVEPPKTTFDIPGIETSPFWAYSTPAVRTNLVNTLSQLYSRQRVRDLVSQHGRRYDLMIGSRFDFLKPIPVLLASLDRSKLYVSDMHVPRPIFPDNLVITNPDLFSSLFNAYRDLQGILVSPELAQNLLHVHGEVPNLALETLLFAAFLHRYGGVKDLVVYTPAIPDFH